MDLQPFTNPFAPGTGNAPPLLAGREKEKETLELVLSSILGPCVDKKPYLQKGPYRPVKIIGPRGVGKTALLAWMMRKAEENKIHFFNCAYLNQRDASADPMQHLLDIIEEGGKLLELIKAFDLKIPVVGGGIGFKKDRASKTYGSVVKQIVTKAPLLLVFDEVHHYNADALTQMLQINQKLIAQSYPLGMVLAGTPLLDRHLQKADATFVDRCQSIYINKLSDEAARAALAVPFENESVPVDSDAMDAMVAQTDNYPYFIQLMGQEVWQALKKAGKKKVSTDLVALASKPAREQRNEIYDKIYDRIDENDLLPYASQVIALIESGKGKVHMDRVLNALIDSNPGMERKQARAIRDSLHNDGLIWTVARQTEAAIPSLFSYFKDRQEEASRST